MTLWMYYQTNSFERSNHLEHTHTQWMRTTIVFILPWRSFSNRFPFRQSAERLSFPAGRQTLPTSHGGSARWKKMNKTLVFVWYFIEISHNPRQKVTFSSVAKSCRFRPYLTKRNGFSRVFHENPHLWYCLIDFFTSFFNNIIIYYHIIFHIDHTENPEIGCVHLYCIWFTDRWLPC